MKEACFHSQGERPGHLTTGTQPLGCFSVEGRVSLSASQAPKVTSSGTIWLPSCLPLRAQEKEGHFSAPSVWAGLQGWHYTLFNPTGGGIFPVILCGLLQQASHLGVQHRPDMRKELPPQGLMWQLPHGPLARGIPSPRSLVEIPRGWVRLTCMRASGDPCCTLQSGDCEEWGIVAAAQGWSLTEGLSWEGGVEALLQRLAEPEPQTLQDYSDLMLIFSEHLYFL